MVQFNFQGDIEGVGQPQLDFISNILEKKGFKGPNVSIEAVGEVGDNYVASVKRIVINENGVTFKMVAKLAPENNIMREMGNLEMLFRNEHVIYTEILPKFRELQKSAGVPKEEWFRFAECYGSNSEVPNEVILLEDLKEDDYIMLDRFKSLTNDCVKIVLKNLAIYHSLSYVLKHQEPETFASFKSNLQDLFLDKRDFFKTYFQQMEEGIGAMLEDSRYKKIIKGCLSNFVQVATKLSKADTDSKHVVIQQGDGWTNNILFQMEGEKPLNCVLIDYQGAKESSPAFDIMYMLFNSTSYEQRKTHFYEFIDYYHNELDKSLQNYGLKAAFVFSRDQLDADLKRYAKLTFTTCIMVSSVIIRKTEDAGKMKESIQNLSADNLKESMIIQDPETVLLFKSRVKGLVDSFLEFGLLQSA